MLHIYIREIDSDGSALSIRKTGIQSAAIRAEKRRYEMHLEVHVHEAQWLALHNYEEVLVYQDPASEFVHYKGEQLWAIGPNHLSTAVVVVRSERSKLTLKKS